MRRQVGAKRDFLPPRKQNILTAGGWSSGWEREKDKAHECVAGGGKKKSSMEVFGLDLKTSPEGGQWQQEHMCVLAWLLPWGWGASRRLLIG